MFFYHSVSPNYDINNIEKCRYNFLELRILMLIGLFYVKSDGIKKSTEILRFTLIYLLEQKFHVKESSNLIIKIYLNISYNHLRLNEYTESLNSAQKGIDLALLEQSLYCLPHLYARKAIAEYRLNMSSYMSSFQKCIMLFEITGDYELAKTYKKVSKEKYNICL